MVQEEIAIGTLIHKIKEIVQTLIDDASRWYELQERSEGSDKNVIQR